MHTVKLLQIFKYLKMHMLSSFLSQNECPGSSHEVPIQQSYWAFSPSHCQVVHSGRVMTAALQPQLTAGLHFPASHAVRDYTSQQSVL